MDAKVHFQTGRIRPISDRHPHPDEATGAAGTETLIGFAIWLVVWITVALLRPKWWYLAVAFALTVGAAVWISQLPDSSLQYPSLTLSVTTNGREMRNTFKVKGTKFRIALTQKKETEYVVQISIREQYCFNRCFAPAGSRLRRKTK